MPKKKNETSISLEEQNDPADSQEETIPPEPRFLTENALHLWKVWKKAESPRDIVPPQTPNSEYNFQNTLHPFPKIFPNLDGLKIPYVRDKGVKFCIKALGEFFGCKDYKFNMLQFWFLDVLTDCIWAAQDNFHLPVDQQKIVLAWILYLINLIKDPARNLSRKAFFTIFKEAVLVAAEVIDEGCEAVPSPEELFALVQEEDELKSWSSSASDSESSSVEISEKDFDNVSCVDLQVEETRRRFVLPEEICNCAKYDLSAVDSVSENPSAESIDKLAGREEEEEDNNEEIEAKDEIEEEEIDFYKPYNNIPARFLPLPEPEAVKKEHDEGDKLPEKPICKMKTSLIQHKSFLQGSKIDVETNTEDTFGVSEIPDKFIIKQTSEISTSTKSSSATTESTTPITEKIDKSQYGESKTKILRDSTQSQTTSLKDVFPNSKLLEQYKKKQILKDLAFQKLWEQRLKDMANPRKGWIPPAGEIEPPVKEDSVIEDVEEQTSEEDEGSGDEEWADVILNKKKRQVRKDEDKLILNFGVLRAIIDFVFKYFYESFQFTLIKLAFQATPEIVTQKINHDWKIPKRIKQELQKPKAEKVKKPKEKKEKPAKGPKAGKDKSKASKEDKGKKKSEKESKKPQKEKPHQLTKEEKEELARQRKEQEQIEAELRKLEEHKRFMYPLTDAATDDLFHNIFDNWVKVDLIKKGKGGKGKK